MAWLDRNRIDYELINIVENPPSKEILRQALDYVDSMKMLFNINGVSYKELGANVVKSMTSIDAINALNSDGKLVKRPFLININDQILVGFNEDIWSSALLDK